MTDGARGQLPQKLYFRIGEVASLVGVEPHVLRYWEREFRSIRPTKSAKGQRVYSRRDVENLLRVRDLLYREGFTIAGAKKKLQRGGLEPNEISGNGTEAVEIGAGQSDPGEAEASAAAMATEPDGERAPAALTPEANGDAMANARVKGALLELRAEIEAFLGEIE